MSEQPIQVLLIDDEASLREPLARYLRERDFEVQTAATYQEAIQQAQKKNAIFDVALVDNLMVPDTDEEPEPLGIQLMSEIRTLSPDMEFILATGWDRDSGLEAVRAGAFRYLSKPFDREELTWLITAAGEQARTRRERDVLSATIEISKRITRGLETDEILQTIVNLVPDLVESDICTVVLCNSRTGHIQDKQSSGIRDTQITWQRHLKSRLLTRDIIQNEELYQDANVQTNPDIDQEFCISGIQSFIGIPIPGHGENLRILYTYRYQQRPFASHECQILTLLVEQVAIALDNARLHGEAIVEKDRSAWMNSQLLALQEIATEIQSQRELPELLNMVARLAVDLLDADCGCILLLENEHLTIQGACGLGSKMVQGTRDVLGETIAGRVAKNGKPMIVNNLPESDYFRNPAAEDEGLLAIMSTPLQIGEEIIGTLDVHSRSQTEAFDEDGLQILSLMANQAALAIANVRSLKEVQAGSDTLHSLYEASNVIISTMNPKELMKRVVEVARDALGAWRIKAVLMESGSVYRKLAEIGFERSIDSSDHIRPDGISQTVFETGEIECIPDVQSTKKNISPILRRDSVGAAACVPLKLRDESIGVMWIDYRVPHPFTALEKEAMRLYANQAAIAYDNARKHTELEYMRDASAELASANEIGEVLKQIVDGAYRVLRPDSVILWVYNSSQDRFVTYEDTAVGLDPELWLKFKRSPPRPGGITYRILEEGWIGISDVGRLEDNLAPHGITKQILQEAGFKSFQGIVLKFEDESLGVLYLNYRYQRQFDKQKVITLPAFANHAALALKKANSFEQVSQARDAAQVVAGLTISEELNSTLESVADNIYKILKCDAITLYTYEDDKKTLTPSPVMRGVWYPDQVTALEAVPKDSIVMATMKLGDLDIVPDISKDERYANRRFVRDEKIVACIAIPLKIRERPLGVIFINYRREHTFTEDELTTIRLLTDQAKIAIVNAQLYRSYRERAGILTALNDAGRSISSSLDLNEIFTTIVGQAKHLTGLNGPTARVSYLALREDNSLIPQTADPLEILPRIKSQIGMINLQDENSPKGVTGMAVINATSQLEGNVKFLPYYVEFDSETESELAVPIIVNDQAIGVINVESPEKNAFNEEDQNALEVLAAQASVAIQNAEQYQKLERQHQHQEAILAASKVISAGIERSQQELLGAILEQAVQRIQLASGMQTILGIFQLCDSLRNEWWVGSVYPWEMSSDLVQTIGHRNTLDRDKNNIGITGRAILEQKPQRVGDIHSDDDYIQSCKTTCSQLSVPLLDGTQVKGVLTLESDESNAFDEIDENALQSLAELSVIAMKNAQQYQVLEETRGRVESATAIAWMGMISATWRHTIGNDATTIQDLVALAKRDIQSGDLINRLPERITKIHKMAGKIRDTPITVPLSTEEGVSSVRVNEFLSERIQRLWKYEPYKKIQLQPFDFELDYDTAVTISPEWFRQVVDTLIDNAVEAMADSEICEITISTCYVDNGAAIFVKDTGPGIPDHIAAQFLKDKVEKQSGEKGLGIGLLIAQMIVNTYGGRIELEKSDLSGTVMCIWLPQNKSV